MIDLSKIKRYDKPHKVFIPSRYGLYVKEEDIIALLKESADLPEAGSGYALLGEVMDKIDIFLGFLGIDDFESKDELDLYFKGAREVKELIKVMQNKLKTNFA